MNFKTIFLALFLPIFAFGATNTFDNVKINTSLKYLPGTPATDVPLVGVSAAGILQYSRLVLTNPASTATFTLAAGKTFVMSNSMTFTGTDGSSVAFGTGGTVAYVGQTQYGILYGGGAGAQYGVTAVGSSGQVLTSNGAGVAPTFQAGGSGAQTNAPNVWTLGVQTFTQSTVQNGTGNTMPNQTYSGDSSVITGALGDARYGAMIRSDTYCNTGVNVLHLSSNNFIQASPMGFAVGAFHQYKGNSSDTALMKVILNIKTGAYAIPAGKVTFGPNIWYDQGNTIAVLSSHYYRVDLRQHE